MDANILSLKEIVVYGDWGRVGRVPIILPWMVGRTTHSLLICYSKSSSLATRVYAEMVLWCLYSRSQGWLWMKWLLHLVWCHGCRHADRTSSLDQASSGTLATAPSTRDSWYTLAHPLTFTAAVYEDVSAAIQQPCRHGQSLTQSLSLEHPWSTSHTQSTPGLDLLFVGGASI